MFRSLLLTLALLILVAGPAAAERVLRVCMTDTPHVPWRLPMASGQSVPRGLDHQLLDQFERQLGWKVERQLMASRRCLVELQQGRADATVGLSYSTERAAYLRYPMQGGQPDNNQALRLDSYSLYHRKGSEVSWDGQKLILPADAVVEVPAGTSIAHTLRGMGIPVGERTRHSTELLNWVARGDVVAVAVGTSEAESQIQDEPALQALVRAQPVLSTKHYFVVFSKDFARRHEAALPALWAGFQRAARFPAYQAAAREAARYTLPSR